jgi:hypothetical protein
MQIDLRVPNLGQVPVEEVLQLVSVTDKEFTPFTEPLMAFAGELSNRLMAHPASQQFPDVVALAYWMRPSELRRLSDRFKARLDPSVVQVPRGLVFHVAPSNVDTIFVYSWLVALLVGNRNVVRLPRNAPAPVELLCDVLNGVLAEPDFRALSSTTAMVRYGHEQEITAALSAEADVRMVWGGDETIAAIRRVPLHARAKEICFADRYSLSAVHAGAFLECTQDARINLCRHFHNDMLWFDQMACSSPRLLIWCGKRELCEEASRSFRALLCAAVKESGYAPSTASVLGKEAFAFSAIIDQPVEQYDRLNNALTFLRLSSLEGLDRAHCGAGLLYECFVTGLDELLGFVARKDQTLTHFGFSVNELREWVQRAGSRSVDRLVPVGQALAFQATWDGFDLLQELVRHVHVGSNQERHAQHGSK